MDGLPNGVPSRIEIGESPGCRQNWSLRKENLGEMMPPCPDKKLELEYTAGRFPWTEYANGSDRRYTQLLSFRHFKSLHRSFRIQLRLLFYHLNDLPRSHPIYLNTNLLPTSVKAKKILDDLPGRCYEMYRIAVKISHDDLSQLSNVRKSYGLREEWDDCISSRKEAWRRCQLLHGGIPPSAISDPWVGEK